MFPSIPSIQDRMVRPEAVSAVKASVLEALCEGLLPINRMVMGLDIIPVSDQKVTHEEKIFSGWPH